MHQPEPGGRNRLKAGCRRLPPCLQNLDGVPAGAPCSACGTCARSQRPLVTEDDWIYLLRLAGFGLLVVAIMGKNVKAAGR